MERPRPSDAPPRRARILVAEDEAELRLTLCEWLTLRGYDVWEARDGLEALELASREPFDVVLTDLRMPRCDGLNLLACLNSMDPSIAVVFMSGQATVSDAIEALREGRSFDFLQKPLHDLRRVNEVVERALLHRGSKGEEAKPSQDWQKLPPDIAEAIADEPILQTALRFIEASFRAPIGLFDVAAATRYTPSYLTNRMRRVTGKTVQQWIITYKLQEAQHLLQATDWPIQRIASTLGYMDAGSFHRQFRKAFGATPQAWRQRPTTGVTPWLDSPAHGGR